MKQLSQLNKIEKVLLLKSIAAGKVDRESLNPETLLATNKGDAFLGLMIKSNNQDASVICIGEAKKAMEYLNEIEVQNECGRG
ncbi:MAG: hypothetical protein Q8S54_11695 [Bacteroidota bacterium]|nr:hypothetical protein [Bacteroidota bacterium]